MSKLNIKQTIKSEDTEEWLDIYFTRPLGLLWAKFFIRLNVHPNVVTIISIFLGIGAGICFSNSNYFVNCLGILLLIWANLYDSCDGQMARMTNQKTQIGRILDGFAGDVWFLGIYLSITYRLWPQWHIWGLVLCLIAGVFCHAQQSGLADYYRNIHLFFIKGKAGSELDNSFRLLKEYKTLTYSKDLVKKLFLFFYIRYTKSQEKKTPKFQVLYRKMRNSNSPKLILKFKEDFREMSLPLMKYTNFLTFNSRAIILFISILTKQLYLLPLMEITLYSIIYLYMKYKHERLCQILLIRYFND